MSRSSARFNGDDLPENIRKAMARTPGVVIGRIMDGGEVFPVSTPPVPAVALTTAERELQTAAESWLRHQGIEALHLSHRAREKVGWPDLTFSAWGHPIAVEIKSAGGRLTIDQRRVLRRMADEVNGWRVYVWDPAGRETEFPVVRTFDEFCGMVRAYNPGEGHRSATEKGQVQ